MNKYQKAYEILLEVWQGDKTEEEGFPDYDDINEALDTLKQALERLETLEKENKELKEKAQKYDELCKHNVMESQSFGDDLIQGILALNKRIIENNKKYIKENEKLKKAIKILKMHNLTIRYIPEITHPHLSLNDYGDGVTLDINEYELLKEVLEND